MIERTYEYVYVPYAVCGSKGADTIYESIQPTGSIVGEINVRLVMCNNCGFVYSNPRLNQHAIHNHYEKSSIASGQIYHDTDPGSRHGKLTTERISFIGNYLSEFSVGRLLDIGASCGDLLMGFITTNWELVGLEPSQHAGDTARTRGLKIYTQNIENITIDALGRFEVICMISVLEHLFNPRLAISKVADLLKSGGILVLEVPNSSRPFATIAEFYSFEHLSHFTLGSLKRLLLQFQFKVVSVDENVSVPNLRIAAIKQESGGIHYDFPDDRMKMLESIQWYKDSKSAIEQSLRNRLGSKIRKWKRNRSKVALYGAGLHSHHLLGIVNFENCITCFLDSDPKKVGTKFMDWLVYGPESINILGLDAIVISSKDYQNEIYKRIQHHVQEGIEIIKCY